MAEYGYAYKSVSTYSTNSVRNETRKPIVIQQPFVPSVPKTTDHGYSEGHVTRKTIIPVTSSRPYDHDSAPPSPLRGSPRKVDDFPSPTKVHNDTNRPQRFTPAANPTGWRHTPPAYNGGEGRKPVGSAGTTINNHDGSNGYGSDYGGNKEGPRKPIFGSTIRNNDDNYDGYGSDYGSMKGHGYDQGRKPIGSANHDGYDVHGSNGYGGHKEGRKPIESTISNAHNGYGSDYGSKKGHKPIGSIIRNDNYDGYNGTNGNGYGDYNSNKEGHKPIGGNIRNDNHNHGGYYNGTNNGYGGHKGHKPIGSSTKIDNYQYDGPNGYGGYGGHGHDDDHYNNKKEGYKPISNPNYNNGHMHKPIGPIISSAWTAAPRRGTQLSEPTNDIEKALELLRMEAAKREHMHNNNNDDDDDDNYEYQYDGPTPTPLANWAALSGPGYNRKPTGGSPQHGSPRVSNKFGKSQLHMSPTATLIDYGDEYGHVAVIDSREAAMKFKGSRV